jgi:predicted nucleotide-binding protein (sugar kinase/HSP70/actin superfamily)
MGERLLRKIYTKEALDKMSADEFQEAKKAEKQRLKILHTQQVLLSDTQKARVILLSYTQARFVPFSRDHILCRLLVI